MGSFFGENELQGSACRAANRGDMSSSMDCADARADPSCPDPSRTPSIGSDAPPVPSTEPAAIPAMQDPVSVPLFAVSVSIAESPCPDLSAKLRRQTFVKCRVNQNLAKKTRSVVKLF